MATEIIMPTLGETMDEGTVARWLVESGATVTKGQTIAEIETNKAVFELEAPAAGKLVIQTQAGATVPILSVIGWIIAPGESVPSAGAPVQPAVTAAELSLAEVEAGAQPPTHAQAAGERQFVSPRARRFAHERGVDLAQVKGTGPQGRVEERDVRAYLEQQPRLSPLARKLATEAGVTVPPSARPRERILRADIQQQIARTAVEARPPAAAPQETVAPMGTVRRVIAQRMSQSTQTTASVTLTTEVDATELVHLREQIKGHVEQQTGQTLSYNILLAKLVAIALREYPYMTSRLVGDEIHTPAAINIGIAMDTERGLIVPVLRDVDGKGLIALSREAADLTNKARSGTIGPDDLTGGVFTITNLGVYGVDAFTPIINLPECAILGVGRIVQKPAAWQEQITLRHMVVLSLTFDHRVVDGAPAARFLRRVAELIQNPYIVLL